MIEHDRDRIAQMLNDGVVAVRDAVRGRVLAGRDFDLPGLAEIRFYAERGMPAYAYGPGLLAVAHGPKEFVDTERIVECAMIYARVAATVLAGP